MADQISAPTVSKLAFALRNNTLHLTISQFLYHRIILYLPNIYHMTTWKRKITNFHNLKQSIQNATQLKTQHNEVGKSH